MALPREYLDQECGLARSLEIVGERWTLLIIRDAFYGVRRWSDFRDHIGVPRAVLSERLNFLVEQGILARDGSEYALTDKGRQLWPAVWSLLSWGNAHYLDSRRRRPFTHTGCGGSIGADGTCGQCGIVPPPEELTIHPRRGRPRTTKSDPVSQALRAPHPLLEPIRYGGPSS